jgi:6-phosphofructokinase 1
MLKGNAIIGQSGGPTSVINASLAGVITAAKQNPDVPHVLGMRYGIEGFLEDNIIDLAAQPDATIQGLRRTPSSALGSCRYKLKDEDLPAVLARLKQHDIRYIFLIGGNDTMDTIHRVEAYCAQNGYDCFGVGVPKTVDNDLFGTDHTPGFPSAARYMALSVHQAGVLARDMQRVDQFVVFQCIGRDAGWLSAAAAAAKRDEAEAPHLIYVPERPFDRDQFLNDFQNAYDSYGFVSIVCGEGITYADGRPVSASSVTDNFANVEFGAMGGSSAALMLHKMVTEKFNFRGEFQITESLPMSAADRAVELDVEEAFTTGRRAVELAADRTTGVMVTLTRESNAPYRSSTATIPLAEVANKAKPMPAEFLNAAGNFPTPAFFDYLAPLIGDLPDYVRLENIKPKS